MGAITLLGLDLQQVEAALGAGTLVDPDRERGGRERQTDHRGSHGAATLRRRVAHGCLNRARPRSLSCSSASLSA
jgi:hypothetical protein